MPKWWPFGRSDRPDEVAPVDPPAPAPVVREQAWRHLPPVQRTVGDMTQTAGLGEFAAGLTTSHSPVLTGSVELLAAGHADSLPVLDVVRDAAHDRSAPHQPPAQAQAQPRSRTFAPNAPSLQRALRNSDPVPAALDDRPELPSVPTVPWAEELPSLTDAPSPADRRPLAVVPELVGPAATAPTRPPAVPVQRTESSTPTASALDQRLPDPVSWPSDEAPRSASTGAGNGPASPTTDLPPVSARPIGAPRFDAPAPLAPTLRTLPSVQRSADPARSAPHPSAVRLPELHVADSAAPTSPSGGPGSTNPAVVQRVDQTTPAVKQPTTTADSEPSIRVTIPVQRSTESTPTIAGGEPDWAPPVELSHADATGTSMEPGFAPGSGSGTWASEATGQGAGASEATGKSTWASEATGKGTWATGSRAPAPPEPVASPVPLGVQRAVEHSIPTGRPDVPPIGPRRESTAEDVPPSVQRVELPVVRETHPPAETPAPLAPGSSSPRTQFAPPHAEPGQPQVQRTSTGGRLVVLPAIRRTTEPAAGPDAPPSGPARTVLAENSRPVGLQRMFGQSVQRADDVHPAGAPHSSPEASRMSASSIGARETRSWPSTLDGVSGSHYDSATNTITFGQPTVQRAPSDTPPPTEEAPRAEPTSAPPSDGPASAAAAPVTAVAAVSAAASAVPAVNVDELVSKLYDPLAARLRAELWLDRERAGSLMDMGR